MEIGYRLYKKEETNKKYADMAVWCNQNNKMIEDKGDYYEIVENAPYLPTIEEQINDLEQQIETLNNEMLRDIIVLQDINASVQKKAEAQVYFNNKQEEKNKLIQKINELKNSSKGE